MEDFLLSNAARHQQLVRQFKPRPRATGGEDAITSPNIAVATRIRPMLDEEKSSGQVPAVFPRHRLLLSEKGVVDLHELRRVVRGPPTLNVSNSYFLEATVLTRLDFRASCIVSFQSWQCISL